MEKRELWIGVPSCVVMTAVFTVAKLPEMAEPIRQCALQSVQRGWCVSRQKQNIALSPTDGGRREHKRHEQCVMGFPLLPIFGNTAHHLGGHNLAHSRHAAEILGLFLVDIYTTR